MSDGSGVVRVELGSGCVDLVSWADVADVAEGHMCTVAPWQLWLAERDDAYRKVLLNSRMVLPDGNGVLILLRIRGVQQPLITGREFVERVANQALWANTQVVVVGGSDEAGARVIRDFGWKVFGGLFDRQGLNVKLEEIRQWCEVSAEADVRFLVALGCPKQEYVATWLAENVPGSVSIGIGGAVEALVGTNPRPPQWAIRYRMEFFYRVATLPHLRGRIKQVFSVQLRLTFAELRRRL